MVRAARQSWRFATPEGPPPGEQLKNSRQKFVLPLSYISVIFLQAAYDGAAVSTAAYPSTYQEHASTRPDILSRIGLMALASLFHPIRSKR